MMQVVILLRNHKNIYRSLIYMTKDNLYKDASKLSVKQTQNLLLLLLLFIIIIIIIIC